MLKWKGGRLYQNSFWALLQCFFAILISIRRYTHSYSSIHNGKENKLKGRFGLNFPQGNTGYCQKKWKKWKADWKISRVLKWERQTCFRSDSPILEWFRQIVPSTGGGRGFKYDQKLFKLYPIGTFG